MASSVETRLPFVDYKLAELAVGLRYSRKDYDSPPKTWLKKAVKDILPERVIKRRKTGFSPPVKKWTKLIFEKYGNMLKDGVLVETGILSAKGAAVLAKGYFPKNAVAPLSYKALVLELWYRKIK
ncbi:MAG: asparagine synthase-related protein, partial [Victivallaceae bacterium]